LNWTRFKERYLFSLNVALAASLTLYFIRKDFHLHWIPVGWMLGCFFSVKMTNMQVEFFKKIGHINSSIILISFYFVFLTPFSIFYRVFFRHPSFKSGKSSWIKNDQNCDFDRPF